jgi:glycosyltransferase involved in cell wall biosynthesis
MIASAGTQLPSLAGRVAARLQNDMPFFIDLTEFVHRPHRSGIQRLGRELCRYWPGLIPAFLHGGRLVALPPETLEHMDGFFAAAAMPPERITALTSRPGQPVPLDSPDTRVVVTEVFYDTVRVQFYRSLSRTEMARCCFVVPDILPLTNPEFFPRDIAYEQIYSYFSLLVDVPNRAFISRHTRQVFFERLARGQAADGPVLRLGSNGLGERPDTAPDVPPPQFTAVGTVEPRKGHLLALDAFESLLPEIPELSLTFFGRLGWVPHRDADRLRRAQSAHPSFLWQEEADDETIRRGIER